MSSGRLIPPHVEDQLREMYLRSAPTMLRYTLPLPKLTRRQRARLFIGRVRWAIHDLLFPDCTRDDYR